jgi:hypothetical protein
MISSRENHLDSEGLFAKFRVVLLCQCLTDCCATGSYVEYVAYDNGISGCMERGAWEKG